MNFFNTKKRIRDFYTDFKLSVQVIMEKYDLHALNAIAKDVELTTGVKFGRYARSDDDCKQIIVAIKHEIIKWGEKDPFKNMKLVQKKAIKPVKQVKKIQKQPVLQEERVILYSEMTDIQLQKETDETGVLKTGTRTEIIARLEGVDNNNWKFRDMSNEWLRDSLSDNKFQIPRSRDAMIERLEKIKENDILLEYRNDDALDYFWVKFRSVYNLSEKIPSRPKKIKELQIVKIKELQKLVRELDRKLHQCQRVSRNIHIRSGNWRGHKQKEESLGTKMLNSAFAGVGLGIGLSIVGNLVKNR